MQLIKNGHIFNRFGSITVNIMKVRLKMIPTVTVIIAAHNAEQYLLHAVRSVLKQTFQDWEIIIVDDASSDETGTVINSINDNRLRVISLPVNVGPSQARNIGWEHASGEYLAFLDADDVWLPDKLAVQLQVMSDPDIGMCYCDGLIHQTATGNKFPISARISIPDRCSFIYILREQPSILPSGILIRRDLFAEAGRFDPQIRFMEDWEFCLRAARITKIAFIPQVLFEYRVHSENTSHKTSLKEEHYGRILKKLINELDADEMKRLRDRYHSNLGFSWLLNGEKSKARQHFRQCQRSSVPLALGFWLTYLPLPLLNTIIDAKKKYIRRSWSTW